MIAAYLKCAELTPKSGQYICGDLNVQNLKKKNEEKKTKGSGNPEVATGEPLQQPCASSATFAKSRRPADLWFFTY